MDKSNLKEMSSTVNTDKIMEIMLQQLEVIKHLVTPAWFIEKDPRID